MAKRAHGARGAWGRRTLIAVALPALLLGPIPGGGAQESEPESGEIRNGTAKATALVSRIGPGVGSLELAVRGGIGVTQVTNSLAQATSRTADLGLIGTSLTAETCRGSQYVRPDDLPQPTFVDNRAGDAHDSRDESPTEGSPFGLGRMEVWAAQEPVSATAITTSSGFDLAPAVRVGGGRAESTARVLPGKGREASATVVSSVVLGAVTMDGMRWHAYHRTGVEPSAEASFDIGRAAIGGVPVPTDDMAALEQVVNSALEPVGVTIRFPRLERTLEPADLVRMTPMRIELRDSPAGKALLGPVLDGSRDARVELFDALVEAVCDLSAFLLVGDIIVTILSGTGFLTLELGGAEATSSDFQLVSPFGAAVAPPAGPVPAGAGSPIVDPAAVPGAVEPSLPAATEPDRAARASRVVDLLCESVHPNRDACSKGAALTLALLALAATIGVSGVEVARQRRARPEVPS